MVVYLSIAAVGILFMVLRLSKVKKKNKEQSVMLSSISEISNTDKMTGCLNRKAYDEDISEIRMGFSIYLCFHGCEWTKDHQ